ncbi:unnamed protein product [Phytophthora fragariaefolia]|uniref:Unnamed protein product n=1 Tax=Phytophthora fragariaefolia TaxID=1490495 RepID=A0A9W6TYF3_9STRA|nr:unnamed protein product [Phytophthora fragariaefolia]
MEDLALPLHLVAGSTAWFSIGKSSRSFVFLGLTAAIAVVVGGAMALSLSHVVQLAQEEDFSSNRVAVLETKVIARLHSQVAKSSSAWRDMQNELQCCGYDRVGVTRTHLSSSWNSAVQTAIEDVNAEGGRVALVAMPASPAAKHKQRVVAAEGLKAHATSPPTPVKSTTIEENARHPVAGQQSQPEQRPATPVKRSRKRAPWTLKYHETAKFLDRESFNGLGSAGGLPPLGLKSTWFPGTTIGESYRAASTIFQAAQQASLETRPVSWGYGLGHLSTFAYIFPAVDQGRVYSWGTQIFGQLGHGEELEEDSAVNIESSGGGDITPDAIVDDQGSDTKHDAGDSNSGDEEDDEPQPKVVVVEKVPRLVDSLTGYPIVKISAGNHFVVAISTSGAVFSWGRGCFGQLGNGEVADTSTPALVDSLHKYVAVNISAGESHVLGVFVPREEVLSDQQGLSPLKQNKKTLPTERSIVMVWGRGKHGCLGLGGSNNELLPRENTFFRGLGAAKVAAGADHSSVLCTVGTRTFLYAFGGNQLGQLGIASSADQVDMPSFLDEFANVHVADIGAGVLYSAALTAFVPWKVDLPRADLPLGIPSWSFITQLSIGSHHSLAQLRISTWCELPGRFTHRADFVVCYAIDGKADRWRKFPLDGIVSSVSHEEHGSKGNVGITTLRTLT